MFIFWLIPRNRLEYFNKVGQKSKTDWNFPPFSYVQYVVSRVEYQNLGEY